MIKILFPFQRYFTLWQHRHNIFGKFDFSEKLLKKKAETAEKEIIQDEKRINLIYPLFRHKHLLAQDCNILIEKKRSRD